MRSDELLAHAEFINGLARSLVLDEHNARDITQETWLAALKNPPGRGWALRGWLAKVTRNFAFRLHRSEKRRIDRETVARSRESVPSPEEIVAREESRRSVIDSLLGLDEPYRSALLLRFYEDLSVSEVARRLEVPEDTVRTRLRRGLERMRKRLDARYGGDRMLWGLALAPFAGLRIDSAAAAACAAPAAGLYSLITGVVLMTSKVKMIVAAAFLVMAVVAVTLLVPEKNEIAGGASLPAATTDSRPEAQEAVEVEEEIEKTVAVIGTAEETAMDRIPVPPRRTMIAGIVTDKTSGEPVTAFSLAVTPSGQPAVSFVVDETVRDERGRFACPVEAGEYDVWVRTADHLFNMTRGVKVVRGEEGEELLVEMDRGKSVTGSVVDDATGGPVAGAVIMPWSRQFNHAGEYLARLYRGKGEVINHARSGEDGRFVLSGLSRVTGNLVAVHADYVVASREIDKEEETVFRLKNDGYRVFGRVRDGTGRPVPGIAVYANSGNSWLGRPVFTDDSGHYRTAPVMPGLVYVNVDQSRTPGGEDLDFGIELKRAKLENCDVEVNFGPSTEQAVWQGTLFDEDSKPMAGGKVFLYPAEVANITSIWMKIQIEALCDEGGRFEFEGIEPGDYNVTVYSERYRYRDWRGIKFPAGVVEQDIHLSLPHFSGVVTDAGTGVPITGVRGQLIALSRKTNGVGGTSSINEQGKFAIGSLSPGIYDLSVNLNGYTTYRKVKTIVMKKGERINNLKIVLARGGAVELQVTGLEGDAARGINVHFRHEGGRTCSWPLMKRGGALVASLTLEKGSWTAAAAIPGLGYVERPFTIDPGGTANVRLGKEDFSLLGEPVTVSGALYRPDGTPASDFVLRFTASRVVPVAPDRRVRKITTGQDGRFSLSGFLQGAWSVHAEPAEGVVLRLDDLLIPAVPGDPFRCELRFHDSAVTGVVLAPPGNRSAEAPESFRPRIALYNVVSEKETSILKMSGSGGAFALRNIPQGCYELRINAKGFLRRISRPFDIAPGEDVDLGEFVLETGPGTAD
jgi:RNA polymerase sigma factor (sigma-70 family)